jgi:hypothetical protein
MKKLTKAQRITRMRIMLLAKNLTIKGMSEKDALGKAIETVVKESVDAEMKRFRIGGAK